MRAEEDDLLGLLAAADLGDDVRTRATSGSVWQPSSRCSSTGPCWSRRWISSASSVASAALRNVRRAGVDLGQAGVRRAKRRGRQRADQRRDRAQLGRFERTACPQAAELAVARRGAHVVLEEDDLAARLFAERLHLVDRMDLDDLCRDPASGSSRRATERGQRKRAGSGERGRDDRRPVSTPRTQCGTITGSRCTAMPSS